MKKLFYFITLCRAIVNLSKYKDTYIGDACKQISSIREELNGGLNQQIVAAKERQNTLNEYLVSCKATIIELGTKIKELEQNAQQNQDNEKIS